MKIITPLLLLMACAAECAAQTVNGQVDKHDYVDLGLPSGTKWATCDVGANKPTETGEFFAWGETKPKETFSQFCGSIIELKL